MNQGPITSYTFTNVQANHTISATFTATGTHTITASAGTGGTITPSGAVVVNDGANQGFTIAANTGYNILQVAVDGVNQGPITTYTFTNVTADHTIAATFTPITFTITASAGSNGTITPSGAIVVNYGANQSFTIAGNSGYQVLQVTVDSVGQGPITSYTFTNVTANHTISATFTTASTYTITASAGSGGTINPSGAVVCNPGDNKTFTITANAGYYISDVQVDSVSQGVVSSYTFSNIQANHTINATFAAFTTPTAYFQFEQNVNDTQGSYNGTAYGSPTYVTGKVGSYVIQFDGSTQYVMITRPISGDWTISFYVKTTQTSPSGSQWYNGKGLVDCEVSGTHDDFGTSYLNSKFAFGVGNPDTTFQSTSTINGGSWKHVACTRVSSTGQMKIYVNGVLETTGTGPTGAKTAATNMAFGRRQSSGNFFNGAIDNLKIYASVLTGPEIKGLSNQ